MAGAGSVTAPETIIWSRAAIAVEPSSIRAGRAARSPLVCLTIAIACAQD